MATALFAGFYRVMLSFYQQHFHDLYCRQATSHMEVFDRMLGKRVDDEKQEVSLTKNNTVAQKDP